jgi:hypothetical protein
MTTPLFSSATIAALRTINARSLTMSVVLRRSTTTLDAQPAYIDPSGAMWQTSDSAEAAAGTPRLYGLYDMDIEQGDRLTYDGAVYEAVYIWPDRDVLTVVNLEARQ